MIELFREILYFSGFPLCKFGWCYGGYVENGKLICSCCGKTIFPNKK